MITETQKERIIETQRLVNDAYADALVSYLLERGSDPATHSDLADNIVGGLVPSEFTGNAMEPYTPALLRCIELGRIRYWRGEDGAMLALHANYATDKQTAASNKKLTEFYGDVGEGTIDFNDPTRYRQDTATLREHAAQAGLLEIIEGLAEGKVPNLKVVH